MPPLPDQAERRHLPGDVAKSADEPCRLGGHVEIAGLGRALLQHLLNVGVRFLVEHGEDLDLLRLDVFADFQRPIVQRLFGTR
ncbi:hypothetical protein D5400_02330 [Georhizobium profundi]|uniref:Uncharacterized protein n=1 Tax=Georhizobium profundi TaxID=2341112 RepID=A0A3Q8XN22_9HYPH|nr:hypothetical protein D5400_02330 [Georhizobium profundi]